MENIKIIKNILNKIYIHPLTYIVLLFSFLASYFEIMYLLVFIITIHEIGHLLMITFLGYDISKITIYPFGGITEYESNNNESILKELLICIFGPLTQVLLMIIVYQFKDYIYISTYENFININLLLFKFNLLPIIPLDGGKILNLILDLLVPYKYSLILSSIISMILCIILIIYFLITNEILISILFILTLKNTIHEYKMVNVKYSKFLLERVLHSYKYKRGKTINTERNIKRNKHHLIKRNNIVYKEENYLKKYIFNV